MSSTDPHAPIVPPRFLFHFAANCLWRDPLWPPLGESVASAASAAVSAALKASRATASKPAGKAKKAASATSRESAAALAEQSFWLEARYQLPDLGQLDDERPLAEVCAAWSNEGLMFTCQVHGKVQLPWCRETRPDESDGLRLWIDTRATHNIHRATRFCHQFIFMPTGSGQRLDQPAAEQILINRAREHARPVRPGTLAARCEKTSDGYRLACLIPAAALTGFDPQEHPRLGFAYAVIDRELGTQTFGAPGNFPYAEDPSLWATLELVR